MVNKERITETEDVRAAQELHEQAEYEAHRRFEAALRAAKASYAAAVDGASRALAAEIKAAETLLGEMLYPPRPE